jgi:hypothetical protein
MMTLVARAAAAAAHPLCSRLKVMIVELFCLSSLSPAEPDCETVEE